MNKPLTLKEKTEMFDWLNEFAASEIEGNHHAYNATIEINRLLLKCGEIKEVKYQ